MWCGRRDLNPHGPFKPCGFSYRLRLLPPRRGAFKELTPGLRSGLSLHPPPDFRSLGAARLVSTPSRLISSGLGSGLPFKVSPNLSSSASPVSQTSTQVFLKSAAYAIPPRPRAAALLMIGHVARFYTSLSSSPVYACVRNLRNLHTTRSQPIHNPNCSPGAAVLPVIRAERRSYANSVHGCSIQEY